MMLPVFPPSIFFNRIPQAQSAAEGGRCSGGFFFGFDPKATSYKARGAAIARVPATSVSPENPVMKLFWGHRHLRRNRDHGVEFAEVHLIRRSVLEGLMR